MRLFQATSVSVDSPGLAGVMSTGRFEIKFAFVEHGAGTDEGDQVRARSRLTGEEFERASMGLPPWRQPSQRLVSRGPLGDLRSQTCCGERYFRSSGLSGAL